MTEEWRLSGLEFIVACDLAGRDTLPHPLRYLPPRMGSAEYFATKRYARIRVQALEPDFFTALRVLANPEIRTAIDGVTGPARIRSCVAESSGFVACARQLPGDTDDFGADVVVRLGSGAIDQVVRALPIAAVGTRAAIHGLTRSSVVENFIDEAVSSGEISVGIGGRGGWQGAVRWLDRADGRYLAVTAGQWTTIVPASVQMLTNKLVKLRRRSPARLA